MQTLAQTEVIVCFQTLHQLVVVMVQVLIALQEMVALAVVALVRQALIG
jgi:hypothetical protein